MEKFDSQNMDYKEKITSLQERLELNGSDTREIKRIMLEKNNQTREFHEKIADLTEKLVIIQFYLKLLKSIFRKKKNLTSNLKMKNSNF